MFLNLQSVKYTVHSRECLYWETGFQRFHSNGVDYKEVQKRVYVHLEAPTPSCLSERIQLVGWVENPNGRLLTQSPPRVCQTLTTGCPGSLQPSSGRSTSAPEISAVIRISRGGNRGSKRFHHLPRATRLVRSRAGPLPTLGDTGEPGTQHLRGWGRVKGFELESPPPLMGPT